MRANGIAHDLAIDEAKRMTDAAMPVVFQARQLIGAGDVESVRDEIADQKVGKLGVPWIFGIGRRLVPRFCGMDTRRVLGGLRR